MAAFPYVNGELFKERLGFADFNRAMHDALMVCTTFDWSRISPAIFGSLFQGVMDPKERRQTGGHYTSERDILKVINALFMDDLRKEFEKARRSKAMLKQLQEKIGNLRFFDPACGCGNFLVITYRELRLLEIEILKELLGNPPFVGKHYQTSEQKSDMAAVFSSFKNIGDLDYVTCWHYRSAEYIQGTGIVVGLVSTNSISRALA